MVELVVELNTDNGQNATITSKKLIGKFYVTK